MPTVSTTITLDSRTCIIPDASYQALGAHRKANGYWCPVGPLPGRAWVLLCRSDVAAVADGSPHTLTFSQGTASAALTGLYFDKAERLGIGGPGEANSVYLAEFADVRALLCKFTDTGNVAANIRSYAQDDDFLTDYDGYSWSSLATELWGKLPSGLVGSFPGLPYSPDGSPNNFRWIGSSAWDALHELLEKINCTTVFNPVAGTFSIVQLGATQAIPAGLGTPLWDGEPFSPAGLNVPATIRVYFPIHHKNYGQERDTEVTTNWVTEEAGYSIDVATGVSGAVTGTILPLWDDLPRVLDEDNSVTNSSALSSRAAERAAKWVTEHSQASNMLHRVYAGPQSSLLPGALNKAVLWRHWGDGSQCATEVVRHADMPRGYDDGKTLWQPRRELLLPPDIGRKTFPNYPRLPNIVQVWDGGTDDGHAVTPNASGLFPARVRRWVAGSLATLGTCWLRIALTNPASIANGECFMGRLSGVETNSSDRRPIYLSVSSGAAAECDCSQVSWSGAAADAHEIELVGTAYPEALTTLYQVDDDDDIGCGWTFTTGDTEEAGETGTFIQLNAPASQEDYSFTCRVSYRAVIRMAPTVPGDSTVVNCWPQWLASSGDPDGAGWATISNGGSICGISSPLGDDKYDALSHSFLWNGIDGDRIRFKLTRVGGEDGVPYTHENTFGTGNDAFVADIDFVNSYAT